MEQARRTIGDDIEEMREYLRQWDGLTQELDLLQKKYPMVCPELVKVVQAGVFHWNYCVAFFEAQEQRENYEREQEEERDRQIQQELARIEAEEKAKARKKKNKKRRR